MNPESATLRIGTAAPHIGLVELNRPEVANALNTEMGRDLMGYFEAIALDPDDIRCVILTGAGSKAFCAGGDLKERDGMSDEAWQRQHTLFERMFRAITFCPVPVIAAVNGAAYGGGCEMAGCCDFIYSADTARFALTEVSLGIIPGGGGTQTLARAVGERRALELILSAKPFTADEALTWGFVNRVAPQATLLDEARQIATRIAANAPISVRQAKQSIRRGIHMSLFDGLAFEIEAYNRTVPTTDRHEGVLAFNEKRPPRFTGR